MKRLLLAIILLAFVLPAGLAATHTVTINLNPAASTVNPNELTVKAGDSIVFDIHATDPQVLGYQDWGAKLAVGTSDYGKYVEGTDSTPDPTGDTTCVSNDGSNTFKTFYWVNTTSGNSMDMESTCSIPMDAPSGTFWVSTDLVVYEDKNNVLCDFSGAPPPPPPGDYNMYSGGGGELELTINVEDEPSRETEYTCSISGDSEVGMGNTEEYTLACKHDGAEMSCPDPSKVTWDNDLGTFEEGESAVKWIFTPTTTGTDKITVTYTEAGEAVECDKSITVSAEGDGSAAFSSDITVTCPSGYCFKPKLDTIYFVVLVGLTIIGLWLFWESERKWKRRIGLWKTWAILLAVAIIVLGYFLCIPWILLVPAIAVLYFTSYLVYKWLDKGSAPAKKLKK